MNFPYRENQYKSDPFDALDHNALKQKAENHKEQLKKKAIELCQKCESSYVLKESLEKLIEDMTKRGHGYIKISKIISLDRESLLSEELKIMDDTIESWFMEKFETKGFRTSATHNGCYICVRFSEKMK